MKREYSGNNKKKPYFDTGSGHDLCQYMHDAPGFRKQLVKVILYPILIEREREREQ